MITKIENDTDYQLALKRVDEIMSLKYPVLLNDEMDKLVNLIDEYEEIHFSIGDPDIIENYFDTYFQIRVLTPLDIKDNKESELIIANFRTFDKEVIIDCLDNLVKQLDRFSNFQPSIYTEIATLRYKILSDKLDKNSLTYVDGNIVFLRVNIPKYFYVKQ
jgi:antitoxin component HigA of HigAB toxin-antitoxin module